MAELKTKVNEASVAQFVAGLPDEAQRSDAQVLLELLQKATKAEPKMWGDTIVGFDSYHYAGKSGRTGDWLLAGFSPRKQNLTLYMLGGWDADPELLEKLGKHSLGKGCLYIKRLSDVNTPALKRLIAASLKRAKQLAKAEAQKQA
jgi:Domain of unknown function (DU1801)